MTRLCTQCCWLEISPNMLRATVYQGLPAAPVVTICPLAAALIFAGAPLNSTAEGFLELSSQPGLCLQASGNRSDPCDGHGCIIEAPCNATCHSGVCQWSTATSPGGDGVIIQSIDDRDHPVCLDYNEKLQRLQAFDCCSTSTPGGHANRSAFQHWAFKQSNVASNNGRGSASFTIRTTMKNHTYAADVCARGGGRRLTIQ